jgi:hypothetical protein
MLARRNTMCVVVTIVGCCAMPGCGSDRGGDSFTSDDTKSVTADLSATPIPVASITLSNGNVVSFYDFKVGALVMEAGKTPTPPALHLSGNPGAAQLASIWQSVAPDVAVPDSLTALQGRLMNLSPETVVAPAPSVAGAGGSMFAAPKLSGANAAPAGDPCNNGCCDYNWLTANLPDCNDPDDYNWFLLNYGYSYANDSDVILYNSQVCAGIGTSTFTYMSSGGIGGSWPVPEASYITTTWVAGETCDPFCSWVPRTITSSVNSSSNEHLHTYCGGFHFD